MPRVKKDQQKVPILKTTTWLCLSRRYYCTLCYDVLPSGEFPVDNELGMMSYLVARSLWTMS